MMPSLSPGPALEVLPGARVVLLAPHPDDEVFGCGGALAAWSERGVEVAVIVLTDGAVQGDAAARQRESCSACALLGIGPPEFWGLPDGSLAGESGLEDRLARRLEATGADLLVAPSPWELHPDHRRTAALAIAVALRSGIDLAFYEVGNPLPANCLLDITARAGRKREAMECFVSQRPYQDYARHIEALNQYRSYTLPAPVVHAEAYLLLPAARLRTELPRLIMAHPVALDARAYAAEPADGDGSPRPRVTVIIRSTDRPSLAQTLDSVALQTWPELQVLVVAAVPGHRPLPPNCGPFPLRLITTERRLGRAAAANRGLDHAASELLLFLDDDDGVMPGHVARLVQALRAHPEVGAAYSGVALIGPEGQPLGQALDLPFDGIRQLAGNLTPIHALVFRRRLLEFGCRFDESLELLEDWDFWLQIARHTSFAHVPGVSAIYRIHPSSGVHADPGPAGEPSALIYRKWEGTWTPGQRAALMERVWSHADLECRLTDAQRIHHELQRRHVDLEAAMRRMLEEAAELRHRHGDLDRTANQLRAEGQSLRLLLEESGRQREALTAQQQSLRVDLEALSRRLLEADAERDRLAREAGQREQELCEQREALHRTRMQAQHELDQERLALQSSRQELAAIRASLSWRLTAPLRRLRQWLRV
jgi:LmbE family N-acetylglucosaminyl deacetylase